MTERTFRHVYGPVPSRRLGRSLGVDLVPFKVCTYDCIYCQLGQTTNKTIERKQYVPTGEVMDELERKLAAGDLPDYISLAGSGEPTLHSGIGEIVRGIKGMTEIPVAVITNGSLLWMDEVQDALLAADLVIPSLDAGDEKLFRHVNRPHPGIEFDRMVEGIASFTRRFSGEVWLEVFLLGGVTGISSEVEKIAALVERIAPARVQLNTVARPTTEDFAMAVSRGRLKLLAKVIPGRVEIISGSADIDAAASADSGSAESDVLSLLERRPCTVEGIASGLKLKPAEVVKVLGRLSSGGEVVSERVGSRVFYSIALRRGES